MSSNLEMQLYIAVPKIDLFAPNLDSGKFSFAEWEPPITREKAEDAIDEMSLKQPSMLLEIPEYSLMVNGGPDQFICTLYNDREFISFRLNEAIDPEVTIKHHEGNGAFPAGAILTKDQAKSIVGAMADGTNPLTLSGFIFHRTPKE